jgi:hypothetical protein
LSTYNIIYNGLIFIAFLLSLIAFLKGYKRFIFLSTLLFITSVVELIVLRLIKKELNFTWLYHVYNIVEYPFLSLFLIDAIKVVKIIRLVKVSILIFIGIGLSISYFYYGFIDLPGLNINIEGILLSIICIYILFNLEVLDNHSILANSNFWICSGILIYFGTTFFFNGVYTKIVNIDEGKAAELFSIINRPLNVFLYSFIIIGILCLLIKKKHSTR